MLTPAQRAALRAEIAADPKRLGLQALADAGADAQLAALLSDRAGAGAETRRKPVVSLREFLHAILPALVVLAEKEAATQAKWDRILNAAKSLDEITIGDPTIVGLFALAKSDGLLTQAQIEAIGAAPHSRAETLLGYGVTISAEEASGLR